MAAAQRGGLLTPIDRYRPSVLPVTYQSLRLPLLVLDTNVVLDWLVFNNPSSRAFTQAIESGGVRWIVNDALRDELAHVLARGVVARWQPDIDALWRTWNHLSTASNLLPATGAPGRPRCTDTDDQKFIDLALDVGASWLLSRDRAVLKLARSAHQLGLRILKPEQFAAAVMPG